MNQRPSQPLTERQVQILAILTHLYKAQGVPPTSRELAEKLRLAQTTVLYQLRRLQRAGKVRQVRRFFIPVLPDPPDANQGSSDEPGGP